MNDAWDPEQYRKFERERNQPFYDLVKSIRVYPGMNVVDLGCGTGKLTLFLHETLKANKTLGIDSSVAMLKEAFSLARSNLQFQLLSIEDFKPTEKYDLIFSNAALQWLHNHTELFGRLSHDLSKNGQLAFQMPANFDFPTHTIAKDIALEVPFKEDLKDGRTPSVLSIEEYSHLLYRLGARHQNVTAQIYPLVLESTDSVVEWVKGSLLTYYQSRLSADKYHDFLQRYARKIKDFFGDQKPFFLPFKRLLIWAQF
jgi:trans-aconitate 2-methyltransferase